MDPKEKQKINVDQAIEILRQLEPNLTSQGFDFESRAALGEHTCPVCGLKGLELKPYENFPEISPSVYQMAPPYSLIWGKPSFEICPCCGFQFGVDDDHGVSVNSLKVSKDPRKADLRIMSNEESKGDTFADWLSEKAREPQFIWIEERFKPLDWKLEEQLKAAGIPLENLQSR